MRKLFAALILSLLFPAQAFAAIAFDNSAQTPSASGNISTAYSVTSNTNGLLILCYESSFNTSLSAATAASYGSAPMTLLYSTGFDPTETGGNMDIWYLTNAGGEKSGSNTLSVTARGGTGNEAMVASYTGVQQATSSIFTSGVSNPLKVNGSAVDPWAETISSIPDSNSWAVICGMPAAGGPNTAGANTTQRQNNSGFQWYGDSNGVTGSSITLHISHGSAIFWGGSWFSFASAGGGGTTSHFDASSAWWLLW
jgi:hypothetical protein